MAKISTTLSIDADVMAQAQAFFASLGMDLSTAVNLLLRQAVSERTIPIAENENDEEALENAYLLSLVAERMAHDDPSQHITLEELREKYHITDDMLADVGEVEFE